jgi:hypothetical protein
LRLDKPELSLLINKPVESMNIRPDQPGEVSKQLGCEIVAVMGFRNIRYQATINSQDALNAIRSKGNKRRLI